MDQFDSSKKSIPSKYNKIRDAISFNKPLMNYLEKQSEGILDSEFIQIYSYMSSQADWENSCRIIFTPKDAIFVPANWKGNFLKKPAGIKKIPIANFESCAVGDEHRILNYGINSKQQSYYVYFHWKMNNGRVFITKTFAGMDLGAAKTFYNQHVSSLAKRLTPFIPFSNDAGHIETESGTQLQISYGIWL